jgi:hypothetical protein
MARRFWRRRTVIIASVIVALSLGIVVTSVPYLPHPHGSIRVAETHNIRGAGPNFPGAYGLTLANIPNSNSFAVGVAVTSGNATFCVTQFSTYTNWQITNSTYGGAPFPPLDSSCILHKETTQDTLLFTPPTTGDWTVVALNNNSFPITVVFSPA